MKLKAGALQLVTFVVVVIALLLSAFILLIHIHQQFRIKSNHTIETVSLVNKGIKAVLQEDIALEDTVAVSLYDEDYKSLNIHRSFWGIYEKAHAKAKIKHTKLSKVALIGNRITGLDAPTLYLKDNNKPLVLVGHTKINGKASLPKRGVKSGNIAGQSYYGEHYIYGSTSLSGELPKLNHELLNYLKNLKQRDLNAKKTEYINLKGNKVFKNTFENPLQLVYSPSDIVLAEVSMIGHLVIQSETKITVNETAKLNDVLLIAPVIEITSNVTGALQAFATERIDVAKDVSLTYPSALVLQQDYEKEQTDKAKAIFIDDDSKISGQILVLGQTQPDNYEAQLKINANAMVEGMIYCEQNLELRGTVYGSVYTNNFIIKERGSIYQNHLFNAFVDRSELTSKFVSLGFENSKKGIAKWLY
ncbi:hypothetical protein [Winogradskyella sp.]|uniref:hypothetical protein n=1 Tax=Winogradskyella sp. TaxID=1883156 RepID=UPI002610E1A8|nr:hypothetical protein [Winogradskyella sp.]